MAKVNLRANNVVEDGGFIIDDLVFNDTSEVSSKVSLNLRHREKTTVYCYSPVSAGSLDIYDVDEKGNILLIMSRTIADDTMMIYTHNHVCHGIYCIFTPSASAGDDSDFIRVRVLHGGNGLR